MQRVLPRCTTLWVLAACWQTGAIVPGPTSPILWRGDGSAATPARQGGGMLLREGMVSPGGVREDITQHDIVHAAQQLQIPPVPPAVSRMSPEALPPLAIDHDTLSPLAPSAAAEHAVPDLGFLPPPSQQPQQAQENKSPWHGSETGCRERSLQAPHLGGSESGGRASSLLRLQSDGDGEWHWGGGGVGGSPIKKGQAMAAVGSGLGASPQPRSVFSSSRLGPSIAGGGSVAALGASFAERVGALAAGVVRCTLARVSSLLNASLNRFLVYLDLVATGEVTWKQYRADCCALMTEVADEVKVSIRRMARRTAQSGIDTCLGLFELVGARVHGCAKRVLGPRYAEHALAVLERLGPVLRFCKFAVRSSAAIFARIVMQVAASVLAKSRQLAAGEISLGDSVDWLRDFNVCLLRCFPRYVLQIASHVLDPCVLCQVY